MKFFKIWSCVVILLTQLQFLELYFGPSFRDLSVNPNRIELQ